ARRRTTQPGLSDLVRAALALALDRAGRANEAATLLAETSGAGFLEAERAALLAGKPTLIPVLPPGELDAIIAIAAEKTDRQLARERWQSFLQSPSGKSGPFSAHARAHRDGGRGAP